MSRNSSQEGGATRRLLGGRMRRLAVLAVTAAAAVTLAACGGSDSGDAGSTTAAATGGSTKPFTVGHMVLTLKAQAFVDQVAYIRRDVEKAGGKLLVMDPDNDPVKQLQLAQNWLNSGQVQVITGSVVDVNAFQPVLDLAAEKGVPVVLMGYQPKTLHDGQVIVNQDFRDAGERVGAAVARCLNERQGGKGKVIIIGGPNLPGPVVKDRIAGTRDAILKDAPGSELYQQDGDASELKALQLAQTLLQAHPDANGAGGTGDGEMLGVLKAMKQAGMDPKRLCIVGSGGVPEALAAVRSGDFYGDLDWQLPAIYDQTVAAAVALMRNPDDPRYSGKTFYTDTFKMIYR